MSDAPHKTISLGGSIQGGRLLAAIDSEAVRFTLHGKDGPTKLTLTRPQLLQVVEALG